jgi:hypothetical protein
MLYNWPNAGFSLIIKTEESAISRDNQNSLSSVPSAALEKYRPDVRSLASKNEIFAFVLLY